MMAEEGFWCNDNNLITVNTTNTFCIKHNLIILRFSTIRNYTFADWTVNSGAGDY